MDEEGLGSPKCFESSMIFQLITVFTWRFDGSATWRYWVARRQRGSCSIHGAWHPGYENWSGSDQGLPVSPIILDEHWTTLPLMCCVSFARRLSMFFKQLGDRSRFEDGMFHCFLHAPVSCSIMQYVSLLAKHLWKQYFETQAMILFTWYSGAWGFQVFGNATQIRSTPRYCGFCVIPTSSPLCLACGNGQPPKGGEHRGWFGLIPRLSFCESVRTQGMLAVSAGMTMSGSWGTLFSELKSYIYNYTHINLHTEMLYTHTHIYIIYIRM